MAATFRTCCFAIVSALALAVFPLPGVRAAPPGAPPTQIADALVRILAAPDDEVPVNRFIGTGRLPAAEIVRRSRALIRALRGRRDAIGPEAYLNAVRRITGLTSRALASAPIVGLAVGRNYRPRNTAAALDFGTPDRPVMPGFERVAPGDPRLEGRILTLRRNDAVPLLSDGLAGIEKIKLPVAPGDYRVILISQKSADPRVGRYPFGRELRVNGVPVRIEGSGSAQWRYEAMLPDRNPPSGEAREGGAESPPADGAAVFARQRAGAVILEAKTSSNELTVELAGPAGGRSYLTGLLVERVDGPSNIVLSPSARRAILPLKQRLELEGELLAEAARAVEGIEPALGQTPRGDDVASRDS